MSESKREYPCPKCDMGELYDSNDGGIFAKMVMCTNPDCDFEENDM